ncbi:helix-turn-helix domain-containing protein [Chitinophaga sp. Cy-1792]|uniref:helix-turn-helix domain-containing protein n=1 Tax=Chitinophaga sp. Cy-1792 TaxID=2608339 RepID=UPI00142416C8|nr:helix-turn-helix domain-containing protein [Chitinophaga sp. Cy-1792]NIG54158.1 AraC family transcriptional regulator [Chitinophaga sp. Cy-1792]
MEFQQIVPPAYLQNYVRYFWTLTSTDNGLPKTFKTIADGCPGLMFQFAEKGSFSQFGKDLPTVFLYGQATTFTEIITPASFRSVGVYFQPHALKSIFGYNAQELTDGCTEITGQLPEMLLNAGSIREQIDIIAAWLYEEIQQRENKTDADLYNALHRIVANAGNISLKTILDELQLSERSLERKFLQHIGMTPKLFARICRFQASLSQLRNNQFSKLSDIAFEQEYADQSHFIRAFKEFAGASPNKYQRQSEEILENFPIQKR